MNFLCIVKGFESYRIIACIHTHCHRIFTTGVAGGKIIMPALMPVCLSAPEPAEELTAQYAVPVNTTSVVCVCASAYV